MFRWQASFSGIILQTLFKHFCASKSLRYRAPKEILLNPRLGLGAVFSKLVSKALDQVKSGRCCWVYQLSLLLEFSGSLLCQHTIWISKGGIQYADFSTLPFTPSKHILMSPAMSSGIKSRKCWYRINAELMFNSINLHHARGISTNLSVDLKTLLY